MSDQYGYRLHAWGGDLHWEQFPRSEPGPAEVLVRVDACGIGLTVLNYMSGNLTTDTDLLPRVPGHELVGTVVAVGAGVDRRQVGQQVVAYFYLSCGRCSTCLAGDEPRCRELAGWVGTHCDGGYAPWVVLPARNVLPVPNELDPVAATVIPDALATPVHVCRRRARIAPGDRVAVVGAGGGVGLHMVQMARLTGASVAGLDLTEEKLAAIECLGATPVPARELDALDPALWPSGPPTVVIDFVGTSETLSWGAAALDGGGRLVVVTTARAGQLTLMPRDLVFREFSVVGSRYARRAEVAAAAELVLTGRIRPMIGSVVEPDGVPEIHRAIRAGTLIGRGALRWDHPDAPDRTIG